MKKNLQLTALALALCCFGVNAQNKTVGSHQPMMPTAGSNHQHNEKHQANPGRCGTQTPHGDWESWTAEKLAPVEKDNAEFMKHYQVG